jgi:hypothetical protein
MLVPPTIKDLIFIANQILIELHLIRNRSGYERPGEDNREEKEDIDNLRDEQGNIDKNLKRKNNEYFGIFFHQPFRKTFRRPDIHYKRNDMRDPRFVRIKEYYRLKDKVVNNALYQKLMGYFFKTPTRIRGPINKIKKPWDKEY